MEDWEDDHIPNILKKEQPKINWDDEDVDENDIKESWEDEEELPPAPKAEHAPVKLPTKAVAKGNKKADYKSTAELFGETGDEKTIDDFIPKSEDDFSEYAQLISHNLSPYEKSDHYLGLLKAIMGLSMTTLKGADAKDIASSVTSIANEKVKAEKEANAGKKKTVGKKKQLQLDKDEDVVVNAGYDDFEDDEFM